MNLLFCIVATVQKILDQINGSLNLRGIESNISDEKTCANAMPEFMLRDIVKEKTRLPA